MQLSTEQKKQYVLKTIESYNCVVDTRAVAVSVRESLNCDISTPYDDLREIFNLNIVTSLLEELVSEGKIRKSSDRFCRK